MNETPGRDEAPREAREAGRREELTLIDLLAILFRQWRLIVGCTGLAVLVAGISFAVYVVSTRDDPEPVAGVEAGVTVSFSQLAVELQPDAVNQVMVSLRDPANVIDAFKRAGASEFSGVSLADPAQEEKARNAVRKAFSLDVDLLAKTPEAAQARFRVTKNGNVLAIRVRDGDRTYITAFLSADLAIAEELLRATVLPLARVKVEVFESFLGTTLPAIEGFSNLLDAYSRYTGAKALIAGDSPVMTMIRTPYILEMDSVSVDGRVTFAKTATLAVVAVFLLAILAALVRDYYGRTRKQAGAGPDRPGRAAAP